MPTALLSVYEKAGIADFARVLVKLQWTILASGGTARALREAGIPVRDVAELVGEPILGHRVVTLSRKVHAALLSRDTNEDRGELERLGIPRIDLVCVDLYPLREAVGRPDATTESVIEMTDIGGPTMIRSAAKGRRAVICDSRDRARVLQWLQEGLPEAGAFITALAAKAEKVVADYCLASARFHGGGAYDGFIGRQTHTCQYGENPYQRDAGLYSTGTDDPFALDCFTVVRGRPSYNTFCDVDRSLQTITHIAAALDEGCVRFGLPRTRVPRIAVACKHGNACGAGVGDTSADAAQRMVVGDRRAIFGGLVMTNFFVDETVATLLLEYAAGGRKRLLDGVVAPAFTDGAVTLLQRKADKCRLLANVELGHLTSRSLDNATRFRYVRGGFLRQPNYTFNLADAPEWTEDIAASPTGDDLLLAWAICATSNSNTTTLVHDHTLIGNGVGQQDRVGCCELAVRRARDAGHEVTGAVACTDSFFPFPDGPRVLADAGVKAILSCSGSVRDNEVTTYCRERGVPLYLVPNDEGRGFFAH